MKISSIILHLLLQSSIAFVSQSFNGDPTDDPIPSARSESMLAWTETDLFVIRRFTPNVTEGLSEIARSLIHERGSMLVVVDPDNRWHVRYFDFTTETHDGGEDDYEQFRKVNQEKDFLAYRCLRYKELDFAVPGRDCSWTALMASVEMAFRTPKHRTRFMEHAGEVISGLSNAKRRQLLGDSSVGDWASQALVQARQAEESRFEMARQLPESAVLDDERSRELLRQFRYLSESGEDVFFVADAFNEDATVARADIGAMQLFITASDPDSALPDQFAGEEFTLENIRESVERNHIRVGISVWGEADVSQLNVAQIEDLEQATLREMR